MGSIDHLVTSRSFWLCPEHMFGLVLGLEIMRNDLPAWSCCRKRAGRTPASLVMLCHAWYARWSPQGVRAYPLGLCHILHSAHGLVVWSPVVLAVASPHPLPDSPVALSPSHPIRMCSLPSHPDFLDLWKQNKFRATEVKDKLLLLFHLTLLCQFTLIWLTRVGDEWPVRQFSPRILVGSMAEALLSSVFLSPCEHTFQEGGFGTHLPHLLLLTLALLFFYFPLGQAFSFLIQSDQNFPSVYNSIIKSCRL